MEKYMYYKRGCANLPRQYYDQTYTQVLGHCYCLEEVQVKFLNLAFQNYYRLLHKKKYKVQKINGISKTANWTATRYVRDRQVQHRWGFVGLKLHYMIIDVLVRYFCLICCRTVKTQEAMEADWFFPDISTSLYME